MPVLLCDLDDTLFDHQHATRHALRTLQATDDRLQAWPLEDLKRRHHALLEHFHLKVLAGELTIDEAREARFSALVGGGDARGLAPAYRAAYVEGFREVDGALALMQALRAAAIPLIIVTNNLASEQWFKLERCGHAPWVSGMVASSDVGVQKPAPEIFEAALKTAGASRDDVVMLGDNWANDVEGARASGISCVWFNRSGAEAPDPTVRQLSAYTPLETTLATLFTR